MRGGPTGLGHEAEDASGVERSGIDRRERPGNEHRRLSDLTQVRYFNAGEPSADPFGDFDHVLGTCRDVRIIDGRKQLLDLLARSLQRRAESGAVCEGSGNGIGQHRVLRHQRLRFEDVTGLGASSRSGRLAHRFKLSTHRCARFAERCSGIFQIRHHNCLRVNDDRRPDCSACRGWRAVEPDLW